MKLFYFRLRHLRYLLLILIQIFKNLPYLIKNDKKLAKKLQTEKRRLAT